MIINPFRFIDPADVEKKIQKLRRDNPQMDNNELCQLIIQERCLMCAASGTLTTLPAIVPVVGTITTLVGGIAIDVSMVTYFMIRMIMEIAAIYERNIFSHGISREAVWVFASAVGAGAASKTISRVSVAQMGNQALVKLIQQALLSLGIRSSSRIAVRIIPLIGAGIAGSINYFICKKVGNWAREYYQSESDREWYTETIDAEWSMIK